MEYSKGFRLTTKSITLDIKFIKRYKMMKKAKLDKLRRIVIPKPLCKELNIAEGSQLLITLEEGAVVVRPDQSTCGLCRSPIESNRSLRLCEKCIDEVLKYHSSNGKN